MKQQDLLSATFLVIRCTQHLAYHEKNKRTNSFHRLGSLRS